MSTTQPRLTKVIALLGALAMAISLGAVVRDIQPTEASWADQAQGKSAFGMHADAGKNYARAISGSGVIQRQVTTSPIKTARALANPSNKTVNASLDHRDSGLWAALPLEVAGTSCVSVHLVQGANCGASSTLSPGTSFASSEVDRLRIWLAGFKGTQIVAYGTATHQKGISATATCVPGESGRARVTAGGPVVLREETELYLPKPNHQTSVYHRTNSSTGITGVLQYHQSEGPGWAKAEARLYLTSNEILADFTFHVVLASAECGLARTTPAEESSPTTSRPTALPESPNMASAASPLSLRSIVEVAEEQVVEDQAGDDLEAIENVDEVEVIGGEAALPSLDDAAAAMPRTETAIPGTATNAPATSAPATPDTAIRDTELPAPAGPSAAPSNAPVDEETSAPESAPAEIVAPAPTEQTAVAKGPQNPESVRVGRQFAMVNRDGVELGTAKIEDIVRTPGCGVELTLNITTSAEAGPDRWASIGPGDFAEVRSSGTTRDARPASSECEHAGNSRTTTLSPGRDHRVVVTFLLDDTAQRAMLRPDGTAGWSFDLPPLTRTAVSTNPSAASPTTSASATGASATTSAAEVETTVATAAQPAAA